MKTNLDVTLIGYNGRVMVYSMRQLQLFGASFLTLLQLVLKKRFLQ